MPAGMVPEIAEADPHVMMQCVWHGNRHAEAHDSMGQSKGVDVPVAQKQNAGDGSPDKRDRGEDGIGQVGQREYAGRSDDRGYLARKQPQQPQQEIALQKELLHEGPDDVTRSVQREGARAVQAVQRVGSPGDEDRDRREDKGNCNDPERRQQPFASETKRRPAFAVRPGSCDDPREGKPVENSLGWIGGPDCRHDQEVAHGEFEKIPAGRRGLAGNDMSRRCCSRCH